jgi:hypothetical protein
MYIQADQRVNKKSHNHKSGKGSFSAYIRIVSQLKKDRPYCYAVLNWNRGKVSKMLGAYPYLSAAPLLEVALYAAMQPGHLTDEELSRLLHADKSYRPFSYRWQHYQAFLDMPRPKVNNVASKIEPIPVITPSIPDQPGLTTSHHSFKGLIDAGKDYITTSPLPSLQIPRTESQINLPKQESWFNRMGKRFSRPR